LFIKARIPRNWIAMAKQQDRSPKTRLQYGAVPYRVTEGGEVEVLLVTTRETGRWIVPKGWPMKNTKPVKAALREAYEEAGVMGKGGRTIGAFNYVKAMAFGRDRPCRVELFPMLVTEELEEWPEMSERVRRWFSSEAAAEAVQEEDLKAILARLPESLQRAAS
jgi:8-oxo-dGTP pyrophosphatase MutT (NUDIX family)